MKYRASSLLHILRTAIVITSTALVIPCVAAAPNTLSPASTSPDLWQQIGPGGGGRFMYPAFDPSDSKVLYSASDMGTTYRSTDGGQHWITYHWQTLNALSGVFPTGRSSWAFDPFHESFAWVGTSIGLLHSKDHGATWNPVDGPWHDPEKPAAGGPTLIAFSPKTPKVMVAAFSTYRMKIGAKICFSNDGGKTWTTASDLPVTTDDRILSLMPSPESPATLVLATTEKILRTTDAGQTWQTLGDGLPEKDSKRTVVDASSAYDGKNWILYATSDSVPLAGNKVKPGVFRSNDGGEHWQPVDGAGLADTIIGGKPPYFRFVRVCATNPECVYVGLSGPRGSNDPNEDGHANIFRSTDGGKTWTPTFFQNPDSHGFNIENNTWTTGEWGWAWSPSGLAVDNRDPNRIMVSTITGLFLSDNGGKTWHAEHTTPVESDGYQTGGGMPLMSAWAYCFDPTTPTRHFIAMTDFGGWISEDAGKTWKRRSDGNPWGNNIYNLAFDPKTSGRVWAASSSMHDIPFYSFRQKMFTGTGGVAQSDDGGHTWHKTTIDKSLPDTAITDILFVPATTRNPNLLYVAAMGKGIFLSRDEGKTWETRNEGLGKSNMATLRIRRDAEGRLYTVCTMAPNGSGGAVYVSDDNAVTWKKLFARPDAKYPLNISFDPHDPQTMAIAVFDTVFRDGTGGIWMSHDAGKTWTKSIDGGAWAAAFSHEISGRVYAATCGNGLKISDDDGRSWHTDKEFPVWQPTNIYFDPASPGTLYVTAFGGGVWRAYESHAKQARDD